MMIMMRDGYMGLLFLLSISLIFFEGMFSFLGAFFCVMLFSSLVFFWRMHLFRWVL